MKEWTEIVQGTISDLAEIVKVHNDKFAEIESRISRLEAFTGIGEFDADQASTNLHRRLDAIEDKVYDRGDY